MQSIFTQSKRSFAPRRSVGGGLRLNLPFSAEAKKALADAKPDRAPANPPDDRPAKSSAKYRKIPEKYYDVETSGLEFTVESGGQTHDIPLRK